MKSIADTKHKIKFYSQMIFALNVIYNLLIILNCRYSNRV